MQTQKVGIREFRERLTTFLEASGPVAITRHGETVGYYIPARPSKDAAHVAALRTAAAQLDALLAASGATEDELVNDFKEARRTAGRSAPEMVILDANILIRAVLGRRVREILETHSARADSSRQIRPSPRLGSTFPEFC